jgi:hypothetical protein
MIPNGYSQDTSRVSWEKNNSNLYKNIIPIEVSNYVFVKPTPLLMTSKVLFLLPEEHFVIRIFRNKR